MGKDSAGVTGGNVWKPRFKPTTALSLMTPQEATLYKKRKLLKKSLTYPSFVMSFLCLVSIVIINSVVRDSYSSTEEYYSLPKLPVMNAEVEGSHLVIALIVMSFIFLAIACISFFIYSKQPAFIVGLITYPVLIACIVFLGDLMSGVQKSVELNSWLRETHGLVSATRINIPDENGLFDKKILTTNAAGESVMLSLELKDLNIYVANQEKVSGE